MCASYYALQILFVIKHRKSVTQQLVLYIVLQLQCREFSKPDESQEGTTLVSCHSSNTSKGVSLLW